MTVVEVSGRQAELSRLQRWSHYVTAIAIVMIFIFGLNLRDRIRNATQQYTNVRAGIQVNYPRTWLIDESADDYIFRVQNMTRVGFKTSIQISVLPVGPDATVETVSTQLSLERADSLSTYRPLSNETTALVNDLPALQINYTFTALEQNPFLESLPIVVSAVDILLIRRGQAIVLTFHADARTFDDEYAIFERFVDSLEFQ